MIRDLTQGNEAKAMLRFALPLIIGNLFQQLYNVADSIIVGKFIGTDALAAVGSSFTLMVFLTSIILGLCMGSGVAFSMFFGAKQLEKLKESIAASFILISFITLLINLSAIVFLNPILYFLNIPDVIFSQTQVYLKVIFYGIGFTFIYNFFAAILRSLGNSAVPLYFLIVSALINIILDIFFIVSLHTGVAGAAWATVIAQGVSSIGLGVYTFTKIPEIRPNRKHLHLKKEIFKMILNYSLLSSIQQSIMNLGILMVQGLVNSFGVSVMAAFAAAVKIDSFAYMPVQDFGNAFSTFIAQNKGANLPQRIQKGIRAAVLTITISCLIISGAVIIFSRQLMCIFVEPFETEIIDIGMQYLFIEGCFYCLIGYLFMFYGFYRGIGKASMSIVLTIASLGTRVLLAYLLSAIPSIGLLGIWSSIPIGWFLADCIGIIYYLKSKETLL